MIITLHCNALEDAGLLLELLNMAPPGMPSVITDLSIQEKRENAQNNHASRDDKIMTKQ